MATKLKLKPPVSRAWLDMQVAPISAWDIRKIVENEKKRLREPEAAAEEEEEDLPY